MASIIRYEYSASTQPPEPTESSTLYTGALSYPVGGGYYCAKKWDEGLTVVTRKSFERPWTPANTTTALWLDANDTNTITKDGSNLVSQWNDKSSNGRNVTSSSTSRPLWSSNKITFDGSNDYLTNLNAGCAGQSNVTIIALMKFISGSGEDLPISLGATNNSRAVRCLYRNNGGSSLGFATWANDIGSSSLSLDIAGSCHIFGAVQNAGSVLLLKNGNTEQRTIGVPNNISSNYATIGTLYGVSQGSYYSNIEVFEVAIIYSAITTDIRQKFEGYLAWKWDGINGNTALVTALPSDHPYKSAPPTT